MLFEIYPTGDPYNRTGWDIREHEGKYNSGRCFHRGDLSPSQGRGRTIAMLRRMYPGCKVRVSDC